MSGKIYSYCRVGREKQPEEKVKEDTSYEFLLNKPLYNNLNKIELPSSLQTNLDSSEDIKKYFLFPILTQKVGKDKRNEKKYNLWSNN